MWWLRLHPHALHSKSPTSSPWRRADARAGPGVSLRVRVGHLTRGQTPLNDEHREHWRPELRAEHWCKKDIQFTVQKLGLDPEQNDS